MIKKNKKGAIEDFGELLVTSLIIIGIIFFLFYYISQLNNNLNELPDIHVNDLEAMHTTRTILDWQYTQDQKVYERVVELYNENKEQEIIELLINIIEREYDDSGRWLITIGEFDQNQIFDSIGLSSREETQMEGSRKFLPKTPIPNPKGDKSIKILIKQVTEGDFQNVNRELSQEETIRMSQTGFNYNDYEIDLSHDGYAVGTE
jgi:hypothetical protein